MSTISTRRGARLAALAAAFMLTACGGGGGGGSEAPASPPPPPPPAPTLTASADSANAAPDGAPVGLHAVVQGSGVVPTWTVLSGPGSLSTTVGTDVQYVPPSAEAFDEGGTVTVGVAIAGGPSTTVTIALASADVAGHHWSTFKSSAVQWHGVANDGKLFVAFGDKGRLSTSPDGQAWTARDTGSSDWFSAAAHGDDGWLVVGGKHALLHSADGVAWSELVQKAGTTWPHGATNLAFGNGRYVTAGMTGSYVAADPSGNWSPSSMHLESVAFGNGVFVGLTGELELVRSTNGTDWSVVQSLFNEGDPTHAVAFANGLFAVSHLGATIHSPDGLNWSLPAGPPVKGLFGTPTTLFSICPDPLFGDDLCYSGDATQFRSLSPNNSNDPFAGIAGDATSWVRASNYGSLEWNPQSSGHWQTTLAGDIGDLTAIDYVAGRYVAVSSIGWATSSADGALWETAYTSPYSGHPGEGFSALALAHRGNVLVAAGLRAPVGPFLAGEFTVSADGGRNWSIAANVDQPVRTVIDDGSRFIAAGDGGTIYASADGHAWSVLATLPNGASVSSIAHGRGIYVAVGPQGLLATSPDGAAWTVSEPADVAVDDAKVIFDGQRFVRVDGQSVHTSIDGLAWAAQQPLTASGFGIDLVEHDGEYVMLLDTGAILTSRDLQTWTSRSATDDDQRAVAFCNGSFMTVGVNALIRQSNR